MEAPKMIADEMSRTHVLQRLSVRARATINNAAEALALPARKKLAPITSLNLMLAVSMRMAE
jgi:hypothetical protein